MSIVACILVDVPYMIFRGLFDVITVPYRPTPGRSVTDVTISETLSKRFTILGTLRKPGSLPVD